MAPRSRLLDLERDDVLSFYGAYDRSDDVGATAHSLVFWHIFLVVAALLFLHPRRPVPACRRRLHRALRRRLLLPPLPRGAASLCRLYDRAELMG